MRLHITHTTTYDYTPAVSTAQHQAHLLPRQTPTQTVLGAALHMSPEPQSLHEGEDVHGNRRVFFALNQAHAQLRIEARSEVQTRGPLGQDGPPTPWEEVRAHFQYRAGGVWDPAQEFCFPSRHVQIHPDFEHYARQSFTPGRPLAQAAVDLMQRMHADFTYAAHSTDVHTPALAALHARQGVCQDFAHILLCALRTLGLSARYVSGYLLTEPPPGQARLIGSDASHAWASVYLPAAPGSADHAAPPSAPAGAWLDLDPTNNRAGLGTPGEDYVCLAWGRDYADVSPVRGVIHGGASHRLSVGVTVTPIASAAPV